MSTTSYADWGGIYSNGTKLILCCPDAYAETLARKIGILERSPDAVKDEDVIIETQGTTKAGAEA